MRIGCIADTHKQLNEVTVPECDVLVHAGDMLVKGDMSELNGQLRCLAKRFGHIPHIVIIAGNHDWIWQRNLPYAMERLKAFNSGIEGTIHYLQDDRIKIDGVEFYGSPWQPEFCNWAFNVERKSVEMMKIWSRVPETTDVLITHGPPFGILDIPGGNMSRNLDGSIRQVGCEVLREELKRIKPKLHVFGHIHHSNGVRLVDGGLYVNASICDEGYEPTRSPTIVEL